MFRRSAESSSRTCGCAHAARHKPCMEMRMRRAKLIHGFDCRNRKAAEEGVNVFTHQLHPALHPPEH